MTGLTPREVVMPTLRRPGQRTPSEREAVAEVKATHPAVGEAIEPLERFARLSRHRSHHRFPADLDRWLTDAPEAKRPELATFVVELTPDCSAVLAAFPSPYTQGRTEGRITRLKALKRAMDGRANFDWLRKRFFAAS